MKKPGHGAGRSGRHLTDDDEALWRHTAQSLQPLPRGKARVHERAEALLEATASKPHAKRSAGTHGGQAAAAKPAPSRPVAGGAEPPPLGSFERRQARRIGSGRIEIEARMDLHGLRQSEAHAALRRFIQSSHERGRRWVLVVTGKGGTSRPRDDDLAPWAAADSVGVLRRNVPMWLAAPELRAMVVSYTEAAPRHGGSGALYVQLRNPEKAIRR